jgi:Asp-tRNA(Asn)/Glu-tRNA(Gln) amidotransferase A subunit family amidase
MQEVRAIPRTNTNALINMSATELACLITAGELSATEVVETHIHRIEQVNSKLNAVVVPLFEQARTEAKKADSARLRGEALGPLHGVPITVKECFDIAGVVSSLGVATWKDHIATEDDPLVARLRQAGAIILGKTNVPQLMLFNETDNPVYGRTNNPWDLRRSPGGSSGGEAAIIAAQGSPLGLGSDLAGSLRTPALACGIHALKPTSKRLSLGSRLGDLMLGGQEAVMIESGPMARSVADLELALRVLAAPGLEAVNCNIPPVPLRDPAAVSIKGLRIGVYTNDGFFPASPALRRAVQEAARVLEAQGAQVVEFQPPDVVEAIQVFFGVIGADGASHIKNLLGRSKRDFRIAGLLRLAGMPNLVRPPLVSMSRLVRQRRFAQLAGSLSIMSAGHFWKIVEKRNHYRARFMAALEGGGFDALLCPPQAVPALTHRSSYFLTDVVSYSMLYNLVGLPAGVVATGRVRPGEESDRPHSIDLADWTARQVEQHSVGLPIGVQVAARHWREDVALAIMAALEKHFRTTPDYPSHPPI